jgi:hypothetical protein
MWDCNNEIKNGTSILKRRSLGDVEDHQWDDDFEEDEYTPMLSIWDKMNEVGMYMSDFI